MFQKCTLSAVLAAILTLTASAAALAAPRQKHPPTVNRPTAPMSGAEWWQNQGNAEDMGIPYRRR